MGSKHHLVFFLLVLVESLVFIEPTIVKDEHLSFLDARQKRSSTSNGCKVRITQLPYLQPVFMTGEHSISVKHPKNGYLTWAHGEASSIACVPSKGSTNHIRDTNGKRFAKIECHRGVNFVMEDKPGTVDITTISCQNKVTGNYIMERVNEPPCLKTTYSIGFTAPNNQFAHLYSVCFDGTVYSPLYSSHILYGNEIDHKYKIPAAKDKDAPDFKNPGFPTDVNIEQSFKGNSQIDRLQSLFLLHGKPESTVVVVATSVDEVEQEIRKLINATHFFDRGHLNPNADHLFTTWQWSTYFYVNVAPMWNKINNGNWARLENNVRIHAHKTKRTLEIVTGTYGSLEFCITATRCRTFTLKDGKVPVPQYFWKVVKDQGMDAAIALVVSNNPHRREEVPLCNDLSSECGWNNDIRDKNDITIGAVSFCSVADLKEKVIHIPDKYQATNVLHFNGGFCNL